MHRILWLAAVVGFGLASPESLCAQVPDHTGQVIHAASLEVLIQESDPIVVLQVETVIKDKEVIVFKPVAALKGKSKAGLVRLGGSEPAFLEWARPGKRAICFYQGSKAVTCLDNYWYYTSSLRVSELFGDPLMWWSDVERVDGLLNCYVGSAEKLREHVTPILAGREVVVTAQAKEDGNPYDDSRSPVYRDWRRGKKGRVWRIKASLKIDNEVESEESRYFVGWGIGGPEVMPPLMAALKSKDPLVRAEAAEDLGQLGPNARTAIPALREALNDPDGYVRVYAAEALARIDPESKVDIPVLLAALKDQDAALRSATAAALAELGPRSSPPAEALVSALQDREAKVRSVAAYALGKIIVETAQPPSPTQEVVLALAKLLRQDEDEGVRLWSAKALLKFGPEARAALPALKLALADTGVAAVAADVVARLGPAAVPALCEALQDGDCQARQEVTKYLGEMGPSAKAAVPTLMGALRDENSELCRGAALALLRIDERHASVRVQAGLALWRIDHQDDTPVRSLAASLKDPDIGLRLEAASTLLAIDKEGAAKNVVPVLIEALKDDDPIVHHQVGKILGSIGPEAKGAVPFLIKALRDQNAWVRRGAAVALAAIGPEAKTAIPSLEQSITDADASVRVQAAKALSHIDHQNRKPLPLLTELLKNQKVAVRLQAASALAAIDKGGAAKKVALVVIEAFKDEDVTIRCQAAKIAGSIGPEAKALLTAALNDQNICVRLAAAKALPRTGANQAVPWLLRALQHEDHSVYLDAVRALQKIDPEAMAKVWDTTGLPQEDQLPWMHLSAKQLEALYSDLESADLPKAYRSLWTLVLAEKQSVPFLKERLRPIQPIESQQIGRLVADLDSDCFPVRQKATAELEKIERLAELALRQGLAGKPSLELRRRVERLLSKLDPEKSPERLQVRRAVEALEHINTSEAKKLLASLAGGAPQAQLTQEAKASLRRLTKQSMK